jgi:aquaporin related protein
VGPLLGALVASGFFWFIKSCEYETANPGQDFDDLEASAFNPEEDLARPVVSPTAVVDRSASRELAAQNSQERTNSAGFSPIRGRADTAESKPANAQLPTA